MSDELERLVEVGQLARVDYKGSASFRIVNPNGKVKRKRRSLKIVEGSKPPGLVTNIFCGGGPLGWVENAPSERYKKSTSEYM